MSKFKKGQVILYGTPPVPGIITAVHASDRTYAVTCFPEGDHPVYLHLPEAALTRV